MKKNYAIYLFLLLTNFIFSQTSELYFSMYGEGSASNKFLEIYNGTGVNVDLSAYSIDIYLNGSGTPSNTITLSGTLNNGDTYLIYNPSADTNITSNGGASSSSINFTGDDAITLVKASTILDIIGRIGFDPGTGWPVAGVNDGTADHTLFRKQTVCGPNPVADDSFGTDSPTSEWDVYGQDQEWAKIGTHVHSGCVLGINDKSIEDFQLFPNPANLGYVNVLSKSNGKMYVTIYDVLGKQILAETIENNKINITGLKSGLYLLKITQGLYKSNIKLVVK